MCESNSLNNGGGVVCKNTKIKSEFIYF